MRLVVRSQRYSSVARIDDSPGDRCGRGADFIGTEDNDGTVQSYYGHSFIADHKGELIASFGNKDEGVQVASFDLDAIARYRAEWGFFRDRRTDLYAKTLS